MRSNRRAFDEHFGARPLVAILRGVLPDDAVTLVSALYDCGIRIVEVPLNSPQPFESIRRIVDFSAGRMVVGAGTVITAVEVGQVAEAGGQICVSPNCNVAVIQAALKHGLVPIPGVATPTEAFCAIAAGARELKAFPAGAIGPAAIAAWAQVLPNNIRLIAVGGVKPSQIPLFLKAGCAGIGAGSEIYRAGDNEDIVIANARSFLSSYDRALRRPSVVSCAASNTTVGDSLVMDPVTSDLLWIDLVKANLHRYDPSSQVHSVRSLASNLTSLVVGSKGELIGTTADQAVSVDPETGAITPYALIRHSYPNMRLNDATIDRRGRLWTGSMNMGLLAGQGELHVIEPSGESKIVLKGLGVCNGIALTADGTGLYLIDTCNRTLLRMDVDQSSLQVANVRVVTDFGTVPGKPDGLTLAADGTVWVAMWNGGCVVQIDDLGHVLERIDLPTPQPSSCAFAEDETLFVSTSTMRMSLDDLSAAPLSGNLLQIESGSAT